MNLTKIYKSILSESRYNQRAYQIFMNELSPLKRFPPSYFPGLLGAAMHRGIEIDQSVVEAAKQALLDTFGERNGIEVEFTEDGYNWFKSLRVGHYPEFNGKIWEG